MEKAETDLVRKSAHIIDPTKDLDLHFHAPEGELIRLDSFRTEDEQKRVLGRLSSMGGEISEFAGEEALMPEKLEASKPNRFDFVRRHKGSLITIGSVVVVIAASKGILVRRHLKSE